MPQWLGPLVPVSEEMRMFLSFSTAVGEKSTHTPLSQDGQQTFIFVVTQFINKGKHLYKQYVIDNDLNFRKNWESGLISSNICRAITGKKVLISKAAVYHWKDKMPFPNNWAKQSDLELYCRSRTCTISIPYSLPISSIIL